MTPFGRLPDMRAAVLLAMASTLIWLMTAAPVAAADLLTFKITLSGSNEVPPNDSHGTGIATITFDKATRTLTWSVTFSGLTGDPTMAHFHGPSSPRAIAGIQIMIAHGDNITSPIKGTAVLTEDQAQQLLTGRWYVNIHTHAHVSGEIRAQIPASP
jgi:CHRD domain